jgi:hypothetical protein
MIPFGLIALELFKKHMVKMNIKKRSFIQTEIELFVPSDVYYLFT